MHVQFKFVVPNRDFNYTRRVLLSINYYNVRLFTDYKILNYDYFFKEFLSSTNFGTNTFWKKLIFTSPY